MSLSKMNTLIPTRNSIVDCNYFKVPEILERLEQEPDKKVHRLIMRKNENGTIETPIVITNNNVMKGMMKNKVHNEQRKWEVQSRLLAKLKNKK